MKSQKFLLGIIGGIVLSIIGPVLLWIILFSNFRFDCSPIQFQLILLGLFLFTFIGGGWLFSSLMKRNQLARRIELKDLRDGDKFGIIVIKNTNSNDLFLVLNNSARRYLLTIGTSYLPEDIKENDIITFFNNHFWKMAK